MDKNLYECRGCHCQMRSKPRPGSRQFQEGATDNPKGGMVSAMLLNYMQSQSLGRTVNDPARDGDPANWQGWTVNKDGPHHNYTTLFEHDGQLREMNAIHVRQEPGKDLEIRLTISDYPETKMPTARATLDSWYKQLVDLTPMERDMYFCYLTGGHDWELKEKAD